MSRAGLDDKKDKNEKVRYSDVPMSSYYTFSPHRNLDIGINGFGRIGRLVCRAAMAHPDCNVTAINEPFMTIDYAAYLFKHDSVHGAYEGDVTTKDGLILLDGGKKFIKFFSVKDPAKIPWSYSKAEIICECTGVFTTKEQAGGHLKGGARKVIISAPSPDAPMLVLGANAMSYDGSDVISNASCTTNCLAPICKIIDETFGIEEGLMTTIHAATATQLVVDGASRGGKDWRGGRAAMNNLIPASTGAAKAVGKILPQLAGKLTGMAVRVPTADVSMIDLTIRTTKACSGEELMAAIKSVADMQEMQHIIGFTDQAVVSQDFVSDHHSCIVDSTACMHLNENFHKIIAWYDNEWGYANRVVDLAIFIKSVGDNHGLPNSGKY